MNHFCRVHEIVQQRREQRADELLPIAAQRQRIRELEGALKDLIRVGDSIKMHKLQQDLWHHAALAAEGVLNQEAAA